MSNTNALPDGPKKHKILQFIHFIKNPTDMLLQCQKKYGNTFTLHFPGQPRYVILSDPDDIKNLFMAGSDIVHAGEINGTILKPVLGSFSLLTLDGSRHLFHRKLMLPPFHGDRMKSYGEIMNSIAIERLKQWKQGETISVFNEASDITFDIILCAVFGMDKSSDNYIKIRNLLKEFLHTIKTPFGLMTLVLKKLQISLGSLTPWKKIKTLKNQIDEILFDEIIQRRKMDVSSRIDILSLLIQAKDETGNSMENSEIKDEMLTLLVAGHETSATAIAWSIYHILSNSHVKEKLLLEIEEISRDIDEPYKNISKLAYMDMVVKESLRITPVVPYIARLTTSEYKLGNVVIPKGVALFPAVYLAHHDVENWVKPGTFWPERFELSQEKPYTYLPFGGGMRRCIGAAFSSYEIKIILLNFLMKTDLQLKPDYIPKLIRKGVVISPSEGVPVIVKKKFNGK